MGVAVASGGYSIVAGAVVAYRNDAAHHFAFSPAEITGQYTKAIFERAESQPRDELSGEIRNIL